jgi:hypothetical protein
MKQEQSYDGKLERRRDETYGGEGAITDRRDGKVGFLNRDERCDLGV